MEIGSLKLCPCEISLTFGDSIKTLARVANIISIFNDFSGV